MTAQTNLEAARSYVKKCGSSLEGHDVNVVAFLQIAAELDKNTSGALLAEYRRFHSLLEQADAESKSPVEQEQEDDLLNPVR